MGLNIGAYNRNSIIDAQALARVTQKIFSPENQNAVDVSKLNLSKFNRAGIGLDLYSAGTNTQKAVLAAKAASDFDINLSKAFSANVQYLNSAAAQSLFTSRENTGKAAAGIENAAKAETAQALEASANISGASDLNKDRRGSNPFAFYLPQSEKDELQAEYSSDNIFKGLNIFA